MNDPCSLRWCPHCRKANQHAALPQLAEDQTHLTPLSATDEVQAFRRRLYCLSCLAIWDALELPADSVQELLATREALEDARRQIAMLRLLAARHKNAPDQAQRPALRLAG